MDGLDLGRDAGPNPTVARLQELLREHLRTGRPAFCDRCRSEITLTPGEGSRFTAGCPCGACDADGL